MIRAFMRWLSCSRSPRVLQLRSSLSAKACDGTIVSQRSASRSELELLIQVGIRQVGGQAPFLCSSLIMSLRAGPSLSPRKQAAVTSPREGTAVSQDKQREKILKAMKAELISCNTDVWLKTYSPLASDWPQALVDIILNDLRKSRIFIDGEGWSPINDAIGAQDNEDTTFSCFEKIAQAIAAAVIATHEDLAEKRIWTATARPRNRTYSEVPGYLFLPDFRTILRKPEAQFRAILRGTAGKLPTEPRRSTRLAEKRPPNDEPECRDASDETSDTAVVGEFKLMNANKDKHDVSLGV